MPWALIAPEKRCKELHSREQRKPATREHACAVACGRKIAIGDSMQFVRPVGPGEDPENFTVMHAECWDALPEHTADVTDENVREVYHSGQLERVNGAAECLRGLGLEAWAEMLPNEQRSLGRRYVVRVRDATGEAQLSLPPRGL
jgi:hypothetical protein